MTRPYVGLGYKHFNLFKYIQEQIVGDRRYLKLLNESELSEMLDEYLREMFDNDELEDETLRMLSEAIPHGHKFHDDLADEISAYRYFLAGKDFSQAGKPTLWSVAVEGMQLAYSGKLEESLNKFNQAIKLSKGTKNAFASDIFNYVYGIVLCRLKRKYPNEDYWQIFEAFRQSKTIRLGDENFMIRFLLDNLDKDVLKAKDEVRTRTEYILSHHSTVSLQSWAALLFHYLEFNSDDTFVHHSSVFFQHELSSFLPINKQAKTTMDEKLGGKPFIETMRKRQAWEVMLADLSEKVSKKQEDVERRIVYYMDGKRLQAIVEQTRNSEETWRDGKLLSRSQMIEKGYESMDSDDAAIAMQLAKASQEDVSDADIIVPILADSGRLRYGSYYNGNSSPITVIREKPYLEFKGRGAEIGIYSNVSLDATGQLRHHIVRIDSKTQYRLMTVNALQRDIIKRFLQVKAFPSSALISLKKSIESLQGIIEVREDLPEPTTDAAIQSKGILAIKVAPDNHSYLVSIAATGMEDGTARFIPGDGSDTVYDEVDGLTHCVHRDVVREYENFVQISHYIKEYLQVEEISDYDCRVWTEEGLLHLMSFVYDHKEQYFMEWPEGVALKLKGDIKGSDIDIAVQSDVDWYAVEGNVTIAGKKYELEDLIKMCSNSTIEGFVKLRDEEYVRMSEQLKKHIAMIEALSTKGRKKRQIAKFSVGVLANMIDELKLRTDGRYTKFVEKTKAAYELSPHVPSGITATLRDYQKEGFQWMCRLDAWGAGACLADDMGLGKTLQALTFLTYKAEKGASLVVAPKSVVMNWANEAARFSPQLHVIVLNNTQNRYSCIAEAGANDLVLCTYGLLVTESMAIINKHWNVVCLDESHQIKNRQTIASQTAMEMTADSRIILTGTPLQNNLSELWNQFQFINPGLLGPWPRFRDSFMIPALDNEHKLLLKELTQPFILRRTKEQVLSELPEKLIHTHYVELTENEANVYEEMRRQAEVKFKENKTKAERDEAKTLDLNFFTELMRLRQAACSMRLIHDRWAEQSSKVESLFEILDTITQDKENSILIFSQFTSFLELIKPELKRRDLEYLYLDGQTPMEKRTEYVKLFQSGQCKLFLSSLKAGGLGLNLTAANYVILLDPWWNPAIESQAMDRAHRLGQKRVVSVIRLITSNTIEEKILRLHEAKQNLSDDELEGTAESYKLTYEDVIDMITPF